MVHVRKFYLFVLVIFITISCSNNTAFYKQAMTDFNVSLDTMYNVSGLLVHFPKKQQNASYGFVSPPCNLAKRGQVFHYDLLELNEIDKIITKFSFIDSIKYGSDSVFVLRNTELKNEQLYNQLYNLDTILIYNQLPIPLFDFFDKGGNTLDYIDTTENPPLYIYRSIMPKDLVVYIIDSKAGNFWKNPNTELRPQILGKWKYGYSKGIAVSRKEKLICYWVMVW